MRPPERPGFLTRMHARKEMLGFGNLPVRKVKEKRTFLSMSLAVRIHPSLLPSCLLFFVQLLFSPVVTKMLYKALKTYRDKSVRVPVFSQLTLSGKRCTDQRQLRKRPQVLSQPGVWEEQ